MTGDNPHSRPTAELPEPSDVPGTVGDAPFTVYASIGNSDDKLTQLEWSGFVGEFVNLLQRYALRVHGEWHSAPDAAYQNACVCFEITPSSAPAVRRLLVAMARDYRQDSIAWAVAPTTEFLSPGPSRPPR